MDAFPEIDWEGAPMPGKDGNSKIRMWDSEESSAMKGSNACALSY